MRLSTILLELVVAADATLAGTHELTVEGLTHMRDQLDRAYALARAYEIRAALDSRVTMPPIAGENIVPFPRRDPFHGFR